MEIKDIELLFNTTMSFFKIEILKCPLQYYIASYIGLDKKLYLNALIGRVIHKIYEDIFKNKLSINEIFNDELLMIYILKYINSHTIHNIIENEINYIEILKKVKYNIHKKLYYFIQNLLNKNYKLYIENKIIIENINYKFLNKPYKFIIKPDIYLTNENNIIIIDIKTSKLIKKYFFSQLIFYSKLLYEKNNYKNIKTNGYIYLSRYNNINKLFTLNYKKISQHFNNYLSILNKIYNDLEINNIEDYYNFIKNIIHFSSNKLFKIKCIIHKYNKSICNFCLIKEICPFLLLKIKEDFYKIIEKNIENKIIIFKPYQQSKNEHIIYYESI